MTCEERKDLILEYAAGALSPAEHDELRAHLVSGCPSCAGALAEAEATLAHLPLALPGDAPPKSARDRLMQRVLASPGSSSPAGPASRSRADGRTLLAIFGALAALIMLVVTIQYQRRDERSRAIVNMLNSKDVQYVALAPEVDQPNASGRVVYDHDHRRWHVSVFNLKPLSAEQAYQLWFIMPDRDPVPASVIGVDKDGNGSALVDISPYLKNISAAAITIEKAGGDSAPHGKPQLVGKVQ